MESERSEHPTTFKPQPPPRSPAPAVFKAWREECYGALMTRAVAEDDVETLNWMVEHELVDLEAADELGNTAAHLAVFHDSSSVLRLLHQLGLDLSTTCDAKGFGSPIFYSILLGRVECLEELIRLGYDITTSCDGFGRTPAMVAARHDQGAALDLIRRTFAVVDIQRLVRGFLGRRKAIRIGAKRGEFTPTLMDADSPGNTRDDIGSADCGKVCR